MIEEENAKREMMQNKINIVLSNGRETIKKAIYDFKSLATSIEDTIFKNGENGLRMQFGQSLGTPQILLPSDNEIKILNIHPNAMSQITSKFGIKGNMVQSYFEGDQWQNNLAVHILNQHSLHNDNRHLYRVVDNELRGFLSDKYKRFDSGRIVAEFLVSGAKAGLVPLQSSVGQTRIFFESVMPQVFPIVTEKNGTLHVVFGARISISDFGAGSMEIRKYMMNVACLNGATRESVIRNIHKGAIIDADFETSKETYMLDTAARVSAVRDVLNGLFTETNIRSDVSDIGIAASTLIDTKQQLALLPKMGMFKEEIQLLESYLMSSRIEDGLVGEMTYWKMSQAIGAIARDVNAERARELNDLAGAIFNDSLKKFKK